MIKHEIPDRRRGDCQPSCEPNHKSEALEPPSKGHVWIDTLATVAAMAIDSIDGTQDPQYVIIPNFVHSKVDRVV